LPGLAKLTAEVYEGFSDPNQIRRESCELFFASEVRMFASCGRLSRRYGLFSRRYRFSPLPCGRLSRVCRRDLRGYWSLRAARDRALETRSHSRVRRSRDEMASIR